MTEEKRQRVALVTGANTGAGRAVVRALRAEAVHVLEHEPEPGGIGLHADLSDEQDVARMMASIRERHGRLDVLVACHARPEPVGVLDACSNRFWRQVDGNLTSSFLAVQGASDLLAASGQGRIVLLSSGWSTGAKGLAGLATASAGIDLLVRSLARELGPKGVAVNAIAPAFLDDEEWLICDAVALGLSSDELRARAGAIVPAGKLGSCDALAQLVVLLCQPALGAAIGQTIHCNGGYFRHRI
jgi:NAD(P)-dependent dehydrogenase (short-subunit alcohol dehydrogenase family)